eukprot:m.104119 g.104119  ORF g.104119 m.104119 type:complete len:230 (-) comp13834_c0_seq1:2229-2918(-)
MNGFDDFSTDGSEDVDDVQTKRKTKVMKPSEADELFEAIEYDDIDSLELLIGMDADLNVVDVDGMKPLHRAAENNSVEIVDVLGVYGVELDAEAEDGTGNTALHLSASNGHVDVVRCLIELNADPNVKNAFGKTPLSLAKQSGHMECCKALGDDSAIPSAEIKGGYLELKRQTEKEEDDDDDSEYDSEEFEDAGGYVKFAEGGQRSSKTATRNANALQTTKKERIHLHS